MQRKPVVEHHAEHGAGHADAAPRPREAPQELRARSQAFNSCLTAVRQRHGSGPAFAQRDRGFDGEAGAVAPIHALFDGFEGGAGGDGQRDDEQDDGNARQSHAEAWMGAQQDGKAFDADFSVHGEPDGSGGGGMTATAALAQQLAQQVGDRLIEAVRMSLRGEKMMVRVPLGEGLLAGSDAVLTRDDGQVTVRVRAGTDAARNRLAAGRETLRKRLAAAMPDCLVSVEVTKGGGDERTEYA
jgi:hypothetical protein